MDRTANDNISNFVKLFNNGEIFNNPAHLFSRGYKKAEGTYDNYNFDEEPEFEDEYEEFDYYWIGGAIHQSQRIRYACSFMDLFFEPEFPNNFSLSRWINDWNGIGDQRQLRVLDDHIRIDYENFIVTIPRVTCLTFDMRLISMHFTNMQMKFVFERVDRLEIYSPMDVNGNRFEWGNIDLSSFRPKIVIDDVGEAGIMPFGRFEEIGLPRGIGNNR